MYAILLNEQQALDLEKTARILAKAEDIIYGDATRAVRNCTGMLAKNLPYNEATTIAAELNVNGVGCFVLAMADFYHPPDARTLSNLTLQPDCFGPMDLYGRITAVPWNAIALLAVGHLGEERRERFSSGSQSLDDASIGLAAGFGYGGMVASLRSAANEPPKREMKTPAHSLIDVFAFPPYDGHWRIEHNGFNYACLGTAKTTRSEENFRLFVTELVRHATACYCNGALNAYLSNEAERAYTYTTIRQFDEENLWLLQKVYPNWRTQP